MNINLKNENNNCFVYVIFETLFKNFKYEYSMLSDIEKKNEILCILFNITDQLDNLTNSKLLTNLISLIRIKIDGNDNKQGDAVDFFSKLCKLIKKENEKLYLRLFGIGYNDHINIPTIEHILFPISYDDIKYLDQKYSPEYISIGLDLMKTPNIALSIIHGNNKYSLCATIHHVNNHWYCYDKHIEIINSNFVDKWYLCDNLMSKKKEIFRYSFNTMPKVIIFRKNNQKLPQ